MKRFEQQVEALAEFRLQHLEWMKEEYSEQMAFMPLSKGHCTEYADRLFDFLMDQLQQGGGDIAYVKKLLVSNLYGTEQLRAAMNQAAHRTAKRGE
jgi:hypothetical protein